MSIFKRKNKMLERIRSLEETLGLFYVEEDGYVEHKMEKDSYHLIPKLIDKVDKLTENKKEK